MICWTSRCRYVKGDEGKTSAHTVAWTERVFDSRFGVTDACCSEHFPFLPPPVTPSDLCVPSWGRVREERELGVRNVRTPPSSHGV